MNKLQMNSVWHIQNLIETDDDCQVVTMHDANEYVDKLEADNKELKARVAELEAGLNKIINGYDDEEEGSLHYYPAYSIAIDSLDK